MKFLLILFLLFVINAAEADYKCSKANNSFIINSSKDIPSDTIIDITYYQLLISIMLNPNMIYGNCNVNGKLLSSNSSFFLNLSNNLSVDSVTGINVNGYSHIDDKLYINMQSGNNIFSINIYYKGLPPQTGWGSFVFSTHSSSPVIWSLSEPYGSSDWFPNKNTPSDKADSTEIWITCPPALTGVSNGILYETLTNPDNSKTYKWKSTYPIASYLMSIAVANYTLYKNYFKYSSSDSMEITHYIYPDNLDFYKTELDRTPGLLKAFSEIYSLYPFIKEKYGHAQFNWGGGMEHQTISSMGTFSFSIIAHELAHQWFGDKITCKTFNHIWLNEGFATYSEASAAEKLFGKSSYMNSILQNMNYAKNAKGTLYVSDATNINEIFNSARTYSKGAVVLHMLRGVLGDTLFYNTLQAYVNDTNLSYGTATTEDFQRIAESISGKNLNYFFSQWIYGENYPKYNITYTQTERLNQFEINLKISQSNNSNPSFFTMPCELLFHSKKGDTLITVFNNSQVQDFTFLFPFKITGITFDPDDKILKDKRGDEPIESVDFKLFQNYPNPFNPATNIPYMIKNSSYVIINIYDVSGRQIAALVKAKQKPGSYEIQYKPDKLASGIYLYRLETETYSDSRKMLYIK